jgi:hypothetical protein
MGQFRRKALILALAPALALAACQGGSVDSSSGSAASAAPAVVVRNLETPGSFSVTNTGEDIALRRHVLVEKKDPASGKWEQTDADVRLIASCDEPESGDTRILKRGETLVVKSWNGWSCDGQCPRPCRANIYLGPGEFRFVVLSADGKQRFEGPSFHLGDSTR